MNLTRVKLFAGAIALILALAIGLVAVQAAATSSATGKSYGQVFVDKLAGILGLSSAQTANDLKQAELQTIDQMVKDGRITQAQADALKQRIQSGQGFALGFGFHLGRPGFFGNSTVLRDVRTAELNALANTLGMSTSDLQTQLRAGKSVADLEQARGVSDATLTAALKAAAKGVLDKAVKAGQITQPQEDSLLQRIGTGRGGFGWPRFAPGRFLPGLPNGSPGVGL